MAGHHCREYEREPEHVEDGHERDVDILGNIPAPFESIGGVQQHSRLTEDNGLCPARRTGSEDDEGGRARVLPLLKEGFPRGKSQLLRTASGGKELPCAPPR